MSSNKAAVELDELIEKILEKTNEWETSQRDIALSLKTAVEDFHREALHRLIACLHDDPASQGGLRRAIREPMVYALLRHHQLLKPSLEEQVLVALDEARPVLSQHGGNIELVNISADRDVSLRLLGACDGCSSSQITMEKGVERILREHCDWIRDVVVEEPAADKDTMIVNIVSPFEDRGAL